MGNDATIKAWLISQGGLATKKGFFDKNQKVLIQEPRESVLSNCNNFKFQYLGSYFIHKNVRYI